jgi:EF-P beta-lysylation protein EpmB
MLVSDRQQQQALIKELWQQDLLQAVSNIEELCQLLALSPQQLSSTAVIASKQFPLKVPREFITRMQRGNPQDPLLQQVLPTAAETKIVAGYSLDPLQELQFNPHPGLLHKYHGRLLLTLTGACAINCRYCFRRHFPYSNNNPGYAWEAIFAYIANHPSINEIILSGGDPLLHTDNYLRQFSTRLNDLPQVVRLRIHSRIPIVLPNRITNTLLDWLQSLQQTPVLVMHCNHPQEINGLVINAMQRLKKIGVMLLNQSVLLKGINDNVDTLVALSEALFSSGIQPYYLHILDKVQGVAHFDLALVKAKSLHRLLSKKLPGYLVPKLVQEIPGATAKTMISSI